MSVEGIKESSAEYILLVSVAIIVMAVIVVSKRYGPDPEYHIPENMAMTLAGYPDHIENCERTDQSYLEPPNNKRRHQFRCHAVDTGQSEARRKQKMLYDDPIAEIRKMTSKAEYLKQTH